MTKNKIIYYLILIFIFVFSAIYIINNFDFFENTTEINSQGFYLLFICGLIALFALSLEFNFIMRIFNVKLRFKEWFGLSATNNMYSYILPARGGLVARAFYLKKKYNFNYALYASLLGGSFIIGFVVSSLVAVVLVVVKYLITSQFYTDLFLISLLFFIINISVIFFILRKPERKIRIGITKIDNILSDIYSGFIFFKTNKKAVYLVIISQFALIFFLGLRLYVSFRVIDISVDLLSILIVQSLVVFSMVLSVTPGNLGIKEGIIGLLATMIGVSLDNAIMAAAIDRAAAMVIVFAFGSVFHFILGKELIPNNKPEHKSNNQISEEISRK